MDGRKAWRAIHCLNHAAAIGDLGYKSDVHAQTCAQHPLNGGHHIGQIGIRRVTGGYQQLRDGDVEIVGVVVQQVHTHQSRSQPT